MLTFKGKTVHLNYDARLNDPVEIIDPQTSSVVYRIDGEDIKNFLVDIMYNEIFSLAKEYSPLRVLKAFRKK